MSSRLNTGPSPFADQRVMSISPSEFAISIDMLGPHRDGANGSKIFALASGTVEITFEPLPGVTLGGLLALPRAKIELRFSDSVSPTDRTTFIRLFDTSFQRGGG
jgi:hypothetical protein